MDDYKDKDALEADNLGYGEGHPPYFSTMFLVNVVRDRETGGILEVSFQTDQLDGALKKAKDTMGVEHIASRKDVKMACKELVVGIEQQEQGEETAHHVLKGIEANDLKARVAIETYANAMNMPIDQDQPNPALPLDV